MSEDSFQAVSIHPHGLDGKSVPSYLAGGSQAMVIRFASNIVNCGSVKWWVISDDPHYDHKKARRDRILKWAKQDPSIIVIYQDESWFSGNPQLVKQYGRRDHPEDAAVKQPASKFQGAWVLYAAYEALTGHVLRSYAPRCNQT